MGEINDLFLCECNNTEHTVIMSYCADVPEDKDISPYDCVYMSIHLKTGTFWERLVRGVKYIFGHRSIYGDFDEFIFKPNDWNKLYKASNYLQQINEKIESSKQ